MVNVGVGVRVQVAVLKDRVYILQVRSQIQGVIGERLEGRREGESSRWGNSPNLQAHPAGCVWGQVRPCGWSRNDNDRRWAVALS